MRNALSFMAIGFLILIQQGVDGELLVNSWLGLGGACLACFGLAIFHISRAIALLDAERAVTRDRWVARQGGRS